MALNLGVYESPKKLTEALCSLTNIPAIIKIIDSSAGLMNEGTEKQRPWANLTAVDTELYERFESIGQEQFCPIFKVKLKNYNGEDLSQLQNVEISFENFELTFVTDKYKQPVGIALVVELADISVV